MKPLTGTAALSCQPWAPPLVRVGEDLLELQHFPRSGTLAWWDCLGKIEDTFDLIKRAFDAMG